MGNKNSGRRPNETVIRQNLINILDQVDPSKDRKRMMNVLHQLVEKAEGGDLNAIRDIIDRVDGKPKQSSETNLNVAGSLELTKRVIR